MDIKINQSDLLKALRWTQGIVERKSTIPVLSNILLKTEDRQVQILATDLEVSLQVGCSAQVLETGSALVNAKGIFNIVREAPVEEVHIAGGKDHGVQITSGRSEFKVLGMPVLEFPTLPASEGRGLFRVAGSELAEMIDKTAYAVSSDETRYALNGVYLEKRQGGGRGGVLRMVATDGHRLSYIDREMAEEIPLAQGAIIPHKGLLLLKKLVEEAKGGIQLGFGEKDLLVVGELEEGVGGIQIFIRLIEGKFPKYEQVVPRNNNRILSLPRATFVGALRRAVVIAEDHSRAVQFSLSPGHLEISSSNPELGEVREEVDTEYKGESFQVGFNARYFLDILEVLRDEKVVLELGDELSPCVIRSEFDRGFLALVMPMRL